MFADCWFVREIVSNRWFEVEVGRCFARRIWSRGTDLIYFDLGNSKSLNRQIFVPMMHFIGSKLKFSNQLRLTNKFNEDKLLQIVKLWKQRKVKDNQVTQANDWHKTLRALVNQWRSTPKLVPFIPKGPIRMFRNYTRKRKWEMQQLLDRDGRWLVDASLNEWQRWTVEILGSGWVLPLASCPLFWSFRWLLLFTFRVSIRSSINDRFNWISQSPLCVTFWCILPSDH